MITRTTCFVSTANSGISPCIRNSFHLPSNAMEWGSRNSHQHRAHATASSLSLSLSPPELPSSLMLSSTTEMDTPMFLLPDNPLLSPFLIALVALVLLVSAQSFINKMLEGDQGLGAFLKDGSGYNKSGFRTRTQGSSDDKEKDPLPWLKLPRLDFVEVAGQTVELPPQEITANEAFSALDSAEQQRVYEELDGLRLRLNRELEKARQRGSSSNPSSSSNEEDSMAEAKRLQTKLEGLMKLYGIEYETE